ncbi:Mobile element protein [Azospirillum palustre]
MERAIDASRAGGERIPDEVLSHLAPLGWQHINLTGDYLWNTNRVPNTTGYRPLVLQPNSWLHDVPALSA